MCISLTLFFFSFLLLLFAFYISPCVCSSFTLFFFDQSLWGQLRRFLWFAVCSFLTLFFFDSCVCVQLFDSLWGQALTVTVVCGGMFFCLFFLISKCGDRR